MSNVLVSNPADPDRYAYDRFGVPDPLRTVDVGTGRPLAAWLEALLDGVYADVDTVANPLRLGHPLYDLVAGPYGDRELHRTETLVGWGKVLDVNAVPVGWLPWIAQFVGVHLPADVTTVDARDIVSAHEGWQRGTRAVIDASLRRFLRRPAATVFVDERYPDPYQFRVRVYRQDLASYTYAELQLQAGTYEQMGGVYATYADMGAGIEPLIAAVNAVKPAGLVATVAAISGGATYNQVAADFATYDTLAAGLTTYDAMIDRLPPGA